MIIKRYFAPNIRQAIRKVREEQGPDAVILSNQKVRGGVEIVAAVDYDESVFHRAAAPITTSGTASGIAAAAGDSPSGDLSGTGARAGTGTGAGRGPGSAPGRTPLSPAGSSREKSAGEGRGDARGHVGPDPDMNPDMPDMNGGWNGARETGSRPGGKHGERPGRAGGRKQRGAPEIIWSQEPTLVEMRSELQQLRHMLEHQLSGLAWGELARRSPRRAELIQQLMKLGLGSTLCRELAAAVPDGGEEGEQLWQQALALLAGRLVTAAEDLLETGGVVALVGPTGVGKTTTVAKLAARYALRYGKRHVAMVTIDNYRVGAYEQLRTYGRILDIPVRLADNHEELMEILDDFCDRSLVLIDTVGMSQHDHNLLQQKTLLDGNGNKMKKILLLAATSRLSGVEDVLRSFSIFDPQGCIITKLDESTSLGGVLDGCIRHRLPVAYVCDGQRVPEDIHPARPATLVGRGVEIMARAGDKIDDELMPMGLGGEVAHACF